MSTPAKLTSLKSKVAIVTGAGGGLGREYALLLASYGATIVVNDYGGSIGGGRGTIDRAQLVVDEITAAGGKASADAHDVSIPEEVEAMVQETVMKYGTIHILINNAGIAGKASSHDNLNVDSYLRHLQISTFGTILCISKVYSIMEKQGYGRIINTSSDSIYGMGIGGDTGYCSSKGGVFAMTRDLGRFSPRHGIKINSIAPSAVSRMSDLSPLIKKISHEHFATNLVAFFVVALASEECPVSGEQFSVGGGRAARTTLATVPGYCGGESVEDYLQNFDAVLGKGNDVYIPVDCLDQVSYSIRHATGIDLGKIEPM
ncbi:NAD(P)-binding protein [Hyaloscypha variabilis]